MFKNKQNSFNDKSLKVLLILVIPTRIFAIYPAVILDAVHYSVSIIIYA
jgi:NADH-ubiquinone oxidoreductase chain 4